MDDPSVAADAGMEEHHFVKADEVDQTGADISPVPDDQLMEEVAEGLRQEQEEQVSQSISSAPTELPAQPGKPKRPELRRETSAPPPPLQPPPPAPIQQNAERAPDSLSLAQLRRLMQEMPRVEQPAYAFEYADAQPFVEEVEEWFQYNEFDRVMLMGMKSSFEHKWNIFCEGQASLTQPLSWLETTDDVRKSFMEQTLKGLRDSDLYARIEALESVCYALTGVWGVTAGRAVPEYPEDLSPRTVEQTPKFKSLQIRWIESSVNLIQECSGIEMLLEYFARVFEKQRTLSNSDCEGGEPENVNPAYLAAYEREANLVLTALYLVVEVGRRQEAQDPQQTPVRDVLLESKPNVLVFLVEIIARLRWDESANVPLTRIILLFWKSMLLLFGGSDHLKKAKETLEPDHEANKSDPSRRTPFLTASPLDYHLFRQEITSKYPAYNPPPAVVPLELENNSILPPLPQHPNRTGTSSSLFSGVGPSIAGGNGSILHQSVHIATPAPSPPPSPIGPGGKAGKKQNYQTNQNFPFMYPPLDDSSNSIGGKGTTERQDTLVGKRWEGSDVPASIIEAGKLFSSHVKMTRAMRQLWEERERFMKYDRGWNLDDTADPPELDLDDVTENLEDLSLLERKPKFRWPSEKETDNEDIQRRLDAVESFYAHALVHLQSITIVFLKIILTNVSAVVGQNGQNGTMMSDGYGSVQGLPVAQNTFAEVAIDELDNIRLREVTGKAISGSLLLLLKWFKRSHILKFEYMTQLLLDSNYLPLVLKMFAHQDIDQAVAQKNDRDELGFFHFCRLHSDCPPEFPGNSDEESAASDDEAVPPPISRYREEQEPGDPERAQSPEEPVPEFIEGQGRPEVDELGHPTAPPPKEPITVFSFRNFFSAINFLHIMQKITRDKAHRCLLLVQYKSSTILRKGLKIPDPHLRFYTLKLFKSQVPYCGRKWRQSNMRVITAIYLYCRPELRDDWLAGSDVDAEVDQALPLEQALRGLTHWWHLRRYKDVMGGDEGASMMEEERDFFTRELEAMGWGVFGDDTYGSVDEGELTAPPMVHGNGEWEGSVHRGPLQMEGW